jgi:ubiquinone/menaquinone biosynthesis C-methylase UbiE
MGLWENQLLPRCINLICGSKEIGRHRAATAAGLGGSVVEIGFGSGLNVPYYPGQVTKVHAVDPSVVGHRLGAARLRASTVPVEFVDPDGQDLSLGDASVDAALSTFTLCTIPDAGRALDELFRVLRPGGQLHYLEHGLAPDPAVVATQQWFNRFQQRVAGGCNLNRPIDQLVRGAGFQITEPQNDWLHGPAFLKPWNYLYQGVAIKAD